MSLFRISKNFEEKIYSKLSCSFAADIFAQFGTLYTS